MEQLAKKDKLNLIFIKLRGKIDLSKNYFNDNIIFNGIIEVEKIEKQKL